MDEIRLEILQLCKDFINTAREAYEKGKISEEQYVEMIRLKKEFIDENQV